MGMTDAAEDPNQPLSDRERIAALEKQVRELTEVVRALMEKADTTGDAVIAIAQNFQPRPEVGGGRVTTGDVMARKFPNFGK